MSSTSFKEVVNSGGQFNFIVPLIASSVLDAEGIGRLYMLLPLCLPWWFCICNTDLNTETRLFIGWPSFESSSSCRVFSKLPWNTCSECTIGDPEVLLHPFASWKVLPSLQRLFVFFKKLTLAGLGKMLICIFHPDWEVQLLCFLLLNELDCVAETWCCDYAGLRLGPQVSPAWQKQWLENQFAFFAVAIHAQLLNEWMILYWL